MTAKPETTNQLITPGQFTPSSTEAKPRKKLSKVMIAIIVIGVLMAASLLFLLTSRSVSFTFEPAATEYQLSGGLLFELGGTYLAFPGTYQLTARAPGYEELVTDVVVNSERNQYVEHKLVKLPGRISFESTPPGATVVVNGEPRGTTPIVELSLRAGDYQIYLQREQYEDASAELSVIGLDEAQTVAIELLPDWADVTVTSTPPGATVSLAGETTQYQTPATIPVRSGFAEMTLKLAGYKSWTTDLEVEARKPQELDDVALELADGLVNVTTRPSGAGVTANGRYYGESPTELALRPGQSYKIQVHKAGFAPVTKTLTVGRDETSLNLSLTALLGKVTVEVEPPDATLIIDGRRIDAATRAIDLPVRPHTIALEKEGYAGYTTTLTPKNGLTQQVRVKLLTLAEARLAALKPQRKSAAGDDLLLFDGGDFTMGASRREPGRRANEGLHEVSLKRPFYVATKEVTNAQFKQYVGGHDSGEFQDNTLNKPEQPAVNISWVDAALYCNWLSEKDDLTPFYKAEPGRITGINASATGYRLPTEAEWAFVARTTPEETDLLRFPWGQTQPPQDRHGNYADRSATHVVGRIIFGYNDNHIASSPVGTFAANQHGMFDIGGNVAEWIHDYYVLPDATPTTDPLGPPESEFRVIRGSSWRSGTISDLRLSFRDYGNDARNDVGFRIARYAE